MSDDGAHGLTLIAFIGSVFSPYYALAQRRADGAGVDPLNHCAVNVALYGRDGPRWAMTERGRRVVQRNARTLRIGPSALHWQDDGLRIDIDEISVPWPARIRGRVELKWSRRFDASIALAEGHHWHPIAPAARIDVSLGKREWSGTSYLDANHGDAPLHTAFARWDWSRGHFANGDCAVFYDLERLQDPPLQLGLRFNASQGMNAIAAPPRVALPASLWRIARTTRCDRDASVHSLRTLTDTPFYARSLLEAKWFGESVTVIHESLSLGRFDSRWVQAMLPWRMPRLG